MERIQERFKLQTILWSFKKKTRALLKLEIFLSYDEKLKIVNVRLICLL